MAAAAGIGLFRPGFAAGDHRSDQIVFFDQQVEQAGRDMQADDNEQDHEGRAVDGAEPGRYAARDGAIQRSVDHDVVAGEQAGHSLQDHQRQHQQHSVAPNRIMAVMPFAGGPEQVGKVAQRGPRSGEEIRKPGISVADEAPDNAEQHQRQHRLSHQHVKVQPAGQSGENQCGHKNGECPVEQPGRQIPDTDREGMLVLHGLNGEKAGVAANLGRIFQLKQVRGVAAPLARS